MGSDLQTGSENIRRAFSSLKIIPRDRNESIRRVSVQSSHTDLHVGFEASLKGRFDEAEITAKFSKRGTWLNLFLSALEPVRVPFPVYRCS